MIIEPIIPFLLIAALAGFTVAVIDNILIGNNLMNERYKSIKFWMLGLGLVLLIYKQNYSWLTSISMFVSMAMCYWIIFERMINYFLEVPAFYIGKTSKTDRLLRLLWGDLAGYYAYLFKLVIGFIAVLVFTFSIH